MTAETIRETIPVRGERFEILRAGDPAAPLLLMLHGFPEHAGAWEEMFERLSDDFLCVAPNQRGYGRSPRPAEVEAYRTTNLVADALGVLDAVRPGERAAAVIGHDWGASVAYALAMRAPERLERLIIANGVHPHCFQRELARGGAQSAASQYIDWLRQDGSEDALAADGFARMTGIFSAKMDMSWMTGAKRAGYLDAWSQPGAARGMVNWYRATPLRVAEPGEPFAFDGFPDVPLEAMRVRPPHLLIWGLNDTALLPESRDGLEDWCDDLTVREVPGADHWLLHQEPDAVAAMIREFLARPISGG